MPKKQREKTRDTQLLKRLQDCKVYLQCVLHLKKKKVPFTLSFLAFIFLLLPFLLLSLFSSQSLPIKISSYIDFTVSCLSLLPSLSPAPSIPFLPPPLSLLPSLPKTCPDLDYVYKPHIQSSGSSRTAASPGLPPREGRRPPRPGRAVHREAAGRFPTCLHASPGPVPQLLAAGRD